MSLTIQRLGHRGDGIAEGPVYVARALPGEVVEGEVAGDRITSPRILTPSPDRVRAPCPHYKGCGGCALQHASDDFVAAWKIDVVRQALAAQGLNAPIRGIVTSPSRSRRRAVLSGRRVKSGALVGFRGRASETLVAVPDCHLLHPELIAALPALEALTMIAASRKTEVRFTVTRSDAGVDVSLTQAKPLDSAVFEQAAALAGSFDLARLTWNGDPVITSRQPTQTFGTARVLPPPGAFLQATAEGEAALLAAVRAALGDAFRIADLFAGCGTFALPLAAQAEVHAVEGDAAMLDPLGKGWREAIGLKRLTTEARDLFRQPMLPDELARFDAAVIDPPRAGAEAQMREIARGGPPRIAAVSCDAASFARDARILTEGGYSLNWVHVVDQFLWSPHVELAAGFTRDHMAA